MEELGEGRHRLPAVNVSANQFNFLLCENVRAYLPASWERSPFSVMSFSRPMQSLYTPFGQQRKLGEDVTET